MSQKATIIILGILLISLFIPTAFAADQDQERIYGSELMTPQERVEHRIKMQEMKTEQEREKYRMEHHEMMQERAKAQGKTLPDEPLQRGTGKGLNSSSMKNSSGKSGGGSGGGGKSR
jgi:uncharacterized membrane protein YgcG